MFCSLDQSVLVGSATRVTLSLRLVLSGFLVVMGMTIATKCLWEDERLRCEECVVMVPVGQLLSSVESS